MSSKEIIVIIGGPGSGKTTLIEALSKKGFCTYPEVSRQVTIEAKKEGIDQLFLTNPILFSTKLLEGRVNQFIQAKQKQENIIFLDRGIPDVLAYLEYIGDSYPDSFDKACLEYQYSKILYLAPWEEIYKSDAERYETFEQAKTIHAFLLQTYVAYGYSPIEIPIGSIMDRVKFVEENLK